MSEIVIAIPDLATLANENNDLIAWANGLTVRDDGENELACTGLKSLKTARAVRVEKLKPMKQAAKRSHDEACKLEHSIIDPIDAAITVTARKIGDYHADCERKRAAEAARLEAERQALIRQQQAEADRARARALREQEEQRLREAEAMEASGDTEGAAALLECPIQEPIVFVPPPPPPIVAPPPPAKVAGTAIVTRWYADVFDGRLTLTALAENPTGPILQVVRVDPTLANQFARTNQDTIPIPGIRFYPETKPQSTGR